MLKADYPIQFEQMVIYISKFIILGILINVCLLSIYV